MSKEALRALMNALSLEEKVGQLVQLPLSCCQSGTALPTGPMAGLELDDTAIALCGSLIGDLPADRETYQSAVSRLQKAHPHHIPPVVMRDVIHGCRTMFPIPLAIGSTFDREIARMMARIGAEEARARGVHAVFAPMADVVRDPRWGRVMESPGESPRLCAEMARQMVRGTHEAGMGACAKHFAGYGLAQAGHEYAPIDVSRPELYNTYLPPFQACVDEGVEMVMPAFVSVDRVPAACNRWLLRDVLRGRMGFEGMVISDWGDVGQLINHGVAEDLREAARLAIQAGMNMDMMSFAYLKHLCSLVRAGEVDEALVDDACLRVLTLKERLGLIGDGSGLPAADADAAGRWAQRAAEESCVLLKNDSGTLPLQTGVRVSLLGTHGDTRALLGGWTLDADRAATETIAEAFKKDGRIALTTPEAADVILYCAGEDEALTGEDGSRAHIDLHDEAVRDLRAWHDRGKRVVLVLLCGRPMVLTKAEPFCDAILNAWFPGSFGAEAIRRLLMGDANPSGHLSMTFPRALGQVPIHHDRLSTARPFQPGAPYCNRYRDERNAPLYPFGFGLSYTRFDVRVETVRPTADAQGPARFVARVTNTGDRSGDCVLQLYARLRHAPLIRPDRMLVDFARATLAPGQTREIFFDLPCEALILYDCDGRAAAPHGTCDVLIGQSSDEAWNACAEID